ncbi:hypothetical protein [Xenophilus azovorans]|uniref:hypothetical protein n=1 Tax=Xenophilus azovorans TaxID=151755 RepID=UPI0012ED298C|nr:hypothetical protein [Xenophilus azovorans]
MNERTPHVYEFANGEINVWVDPGGAICIKTRNEFNDPVELAEHDALALAELLIALAEKQ